MQPNGKSASTTDPSTWTDFETACEAVRSGYAEGVGFVFTENDPYVGIDIDEGVDPDQAQWLIDNTRGAYRERSPSGKGEHIIVRGTIPAAMKPQGLHWEIYSKERYFTVTGEIFGLPIIQIPDAQTTLDTLSAQFGRNISPSTRGLLSNAPLAEYGGSELSDADLVRRALDSAGSVAGTVT